MTPQQTIRLHNIARAMRKVAVPAGTMHGWWDVIFDVEDFLRGKPTMVQKTVEGWIKYCDDMLREHDQKQSGNRVGG